MSQKIVCQCGNALVVNEIRQPSGRVDATIVVAQCTSCTVKVYDAGYTDGSGSATHQTDSAVILTETTQRTI